MHWVIRGQKRYLYTTRRDGGRVRRVYCGTGMAAEHTLTFEAYARVIAQELAEVRREKCTAAAAAIQPLLDYCRLTDHLVHATLVNLGYHQHARTWRLRRDYKTKCFTGTGIVPGRVETAVA